MSSPGFPIRALGKMHLRNRVSVMEKFDPVNHLPKSLLGESLLTSRGVEWDMDFRQGRQQVIWSGSSAYLICVRNWIEAQNQTEDYSRRQPPGLDSAAGNWASLWSHFRGLQSDSYVQLYG